MRKQYQGRHWIALGVLIAGLVVGAASTLSTNETYASYGMHATLSPTQPQNLTIGVSVESMLIDFGTVPMTDISIKKRITIRNDGRERVRFTARTTGNLSEHINIRPETLTVAPGSSGTITVELDGSEEMTPGYHEGQLDILRATPTYGVLP